MRTKARNQALQWDRLRRRLITTAVGAGAAYATGLYIGSQIKAGKPTTISKMDAELVIGLSGTLLGVALQAKPKLTTAGEILEAGGMGVLAYYAGSRGEQEGSRVTAAA